MSRRSTTLSAPATAKDEDVFMFDQADEFLDGRSTGSMDNVELKVKEAQEQLLQLRHQSEELERQKLHLEQLRIRQDRFVTGKRDLTDKLSRSVTMLERELYDAQKLVEELSITKDSFNRHLETLRSLQPEKWQRSNVDEELDRALSAVEDAGSEYAKGTRRVAAARPAEMQSIEIEDGRAPQNSVMADDDASTWMRRGFAFTLPLMGTILLTLVLAKLMF
jgi:chromosome segregation ATPase